MVGSRLCMWYTALQTVSKMNRISVSVIRFRSLCRCRCMQCEYVARVRWCVLGAAQLCGARGSGQVHLVHKVEYATARAELGEDHHLLSVGLPERRGPEEGHDALLPAQRFLRSMRDDDDDDDDELMMLGEVVALQCQPRRRAEGKAGRETRKLISRLMISMCSSSCTRMRFRATGRPVSTCSARNTNAKPPAYVDAPKMGSD